MEKRERESGKAMGKKDEEDAKTAEKHLYAWYEEIEVWVLI
jgi:hypothetical protein